MTSFGDELPRYGRPIRRTKRGECGWLLKKELIEQPGCSYYPGFFVQDCN